MTTDTHIKKETHSADVLTMLQENTDLVVLDVRTKNEFNAGHIKGALNIDISQQSAVNELNKLDKDAKYIVHCHTSARSNTTVDFMLKNGFKNIYQMMDGYFGWNIKGFPFEK